MRRILRAPLACLLLAAGAWGEARAQADPAAGAVTSPANVLNS